MTKIEFELEGLPKTTNANSNSSWQARYAEAKKWKRAVALAVYALKVPSMPWPRAKVTIVRCSSRRSDFDGLVSAGKHLVDGLIEAKVIVDDSQDHIGQPVYLWEQAPRKGGKVRIIVEEIEP